MCLCFEDGLEVEAIVGDLIELDGGRIGPLRFEKSFHPKQTTFDWRSLCCEDRAVLSVKSSDNSPVTGSPPQELAGFVSEVMRIVSFKPGGSSLRGCGVVSGEFDGESSKRRRDSARNWRQSWYVVEVCLISRLRSRRVISTVAGRRKAAPFKVNNL